ncbi:hypothetical protein CONLIGDRAFT_694043 [Coniochaeta ligniaria NRRL 30616]|uniref:Uncharacterized protein n=1 Tax=Coniochaeta ligniaria NRRL 30616 TaxID=1408157 RepID=A0A1J7I6T9_9PEZI|nr:hypothetical protein CONLIGDRAFT_694043 [Coniochaeta ligniaria NRRL 30616]
MDASNDGCGSQTEQTAESPCHCMRLRMASNFHQSKTTTRNQETTAEFPLFLRCLETRIGPAFSAMFFTFSRFSYDPSSSLEMSPTPDPPVLQYPPHKHNFRNQPGPNRVTPFDEFKTPNWSARQPAMRCDDSFPPVQATLVALRLLKRHSSPHAGVRIAKPVFEFERPESDEERARPSDRTT